MLTPHTHETAVPFDAKQPSARGIPAHAVAEAP